MKHLVRHTVVLLHHFGGSKHTWRDVAATSDRFVAIDLPGFGDRALEDQWCSSVDAMADFVGRTVGALVRGTFVLCGHSMGGKIAFALASRRPHGLARLVLVAPSPPSPEPMTDEARHRLRSAWGDREALVRINAELVHDQALIEPLVADCMRTSQRAWSWWLDEGSREDLSARSIDVPASVIIASHDSVMNPDMLVREVVEPLSASRTDVDSGHIVPLEAPSRISDLLMKS
jgi:pimeloyl-ACP methyl ester carboxylesterase